MTSRTRRRLLTATAAIAGAALTVGLPAAAWAQAAYPDRPIRLMIPFPPGGLTDILGRKVADKLRDGLGQPIVPDNRPGGGTLTAAAAVAKSPADGYTLMIATSTTLGIAPALFTKAPIKVEDLTGAAMLGTVTFFLVVNKDFPAKDPRELVAAIKAKPNAYAYATPGNGTAHHLLAEMIREREGLEMRHIPYKGSAPAVTDIISGAGANFMFLDAAVALPQIRGGNVRALAVTGSKRVAIAPDVPALTEFFPGLDLQAWQAVAAPAGTPRPVLDRVNQVLNAALADPAFRKELTDVGVEPVTMNVSELNAFIQKDAQRWAGLVRVSGAKVD